jgi:opacity protein-like surface antigen
MRVGAAGALMLMLAVPSRAADMPGLPPPLPAPTLPPAVTWFNGGWYVRGDIGYRWGLIGDAVGPGTTLGDGQLGNGVTAGAGVGLKTRFLRTDFTIDYAAPVKYTGSAVTPDDTSAKISSINFLFNGYLDLGTWHRLTPYIGAGAGAALVKTANYESTALPASPDRSQWNFAYAGMAGVAWAVAPNLQIDFGYRYLNVGDAKTGTPGEVTFQRVAGHEFRVGLRWSFDDLREYH